jgi:hypothetical protein
LPAGRVLESRAGSFFKELLDICGDCRGSHDFSSWLPLLKTDVFARALSIKISESMPAAIFRCVFNWF